MKEKMHKVFPGIYYEGKLKEAIKIRTMLLVFSQVYILLILKFIIAFDKLGSIRDYIALVLK